MSLRSRLMISAGAVVLASLAAVALISSSVLRVEMSHFLQGPAPVAHAVRAEAVQRIVSHWSQHGRRGLRPLLAGLRDRSLPSSELLLVDGERRLIASSLPESETPTIAAGSNGGMRVLLGDASMRSEIILAPGSGIGVTTAEGETIGSLVIIPRRQIAPRDPMRSVNRWLLVAVALVGAAALAFTAVLARRITAPLETLQQAASRISRGTSDEEAHPVAVTSRDEIGRLAEAFNAMTQRLRRNEQLRRNMVNDVAHELRTPLTNLRASLEAMQDGLRAADAAAIDALHDDVLVLQRLVDDLQTLALAEAGKLPLHVERIDLGSELERFVRAQNQPMFRIDVRDGAVVSADRVRLQQILRNLATNAVAHTPPEGRIELAAAPVDERTVRLTVTDDGSGIPESDLPYVFDRFYRADASRARTTGGAGLGLAIVQQLVTMHGGHISVESTPGRGTRFTIDLPRAE